MSMRARAPVAVVAAIKLSTHESQQRAAAPTRRWLSTQRGLRRSRLEASPWDESREHERERTDYRFRVES
jgi:hypothetical protein